MHSIPKLQPAVLGALWVEAERPNGEGKPSPDQEERELAEVRISMEEGLLQFRIQGAGLRVQG